MMLHQHNICCHMVGDAGELAQRVAQCSSYNVLDHKLSKAQPSSGSVTQPENYVLLLHCRVTKSMYQIQGFAAACGFW